MQWSVYPQAQYPGDLWAEWDYLNTKYHNNNPVLGSVFLSLLIQYLKPEIFIAKATENDQTVAILLLEKSNYGMWRVFKASQATLASAVVKANSKLNFNTLFPKLASLAFRLDFFSLDPLEHSGIISANSLSEIDANATNIRVLVESDFEKYWEKRPKKLKANIKRYENRLRTEVGDFFFKHITTPDDVIKATDRYGMLESKGWKGLNGTALHPSNYQGQFYRDFLYAQACRNSAVALEMYVADKLVASRLCCFSNGLLIALKTTFDEDFKKYAVGRLLLKELISWGFSNPEVKVIDFYTNATPEQIEWSTEKRQMFNASIFAQNLAGCLLSTIIKAKRKITTQIQESDGP